MFKELFSSVLGNFLAVVCQFLKNEYNRRSQLKPLFWDSTIQLPLEDVYTRLKILQRRKRDFRLENNEVNMSEIFENGDDVIVLVEGSPGMGKTTFCLKIAHDWANKATSKVDSFPQFEVVLLLKCRDIHGDIIEAIDTQLLPESKKNAGAIKEVLVDYIEDLDFQEKVLIILDGLDELPKMSESCVDKLLQKKIFPFCYVLATSRQERGIVVRQNVDFDMLLQIEGFTQEDAFSYIRKHFKNTGPENVSNGERLITEMQTNSFLDALWNNPLNLLLLCIVFEDHEGELPSYRTELYQIIVCCLLRRYCAKHNLEFPAGDKALMRHFEDSLLVLGQLAWRCLEEGQFSFREEELVEYESTDESLAARTLGLVFKEASLRKINPQHEYFFFHKTFQEYLAAFYLAHMLLKQKTYFSELYLEDLIEMYRQVFIFMSGILGEEAGLLFEQIGKKLKDGNWDWHKCPEVKATFFHDCFSESRNYEKVAMALCSSIPFPQTITIDLSDQETTTEWFIILNACTSSSQLQLPVHLAIRSVFDNVPANVNNDLLADFVAFNTSLQTLSFSVRFMIEEIATLLCRVLRVDSTAYSFTLEVTCSNISSVEVVAISDSLAANKTLTTVTFQLPCKILEDYVAILDKGLSADTPLTSIVLKTFGPWTETEAELLRKILLNRSLTSLSLAVGGKMHDSLATSISEGLVANSSLKSLALTFCGKLSYTGLSLLKEGFLGNRSLESLQLKVFGELPTNWADICGTLQPAINSTTSFTVYPDVTGMVGNSQVAFLCPVLKEDILASKLHSVTVNIWGELDCSGATDLCKLLKASSASCVNLNLNGTITDSVADCLFRHFNKLDTLSYLSIDIRGEVMGDGKNSLQRLSYNQVYLFAFNVHSFNSGNKICREICLSTDDSSSITPVFTKVKDSCMTKLSVSINNPGRISEDWKCNLFEGLAKNECLTTLNLIFNSSYLVENIDSLWDAVGENATLTTVNLTVNNRRDTGGDQICILGVGLAKSTSLTMLSLTFNNYSKIFGDLTLELGDGLAKNTSLTSLSLTVNNYGYIGEEWAHGLGDGLAKNTSLTTLSLTVNNYDNMSGDWKCRLSDGLGKNTSLTTLSFTVNDFIESIEQLTFDDLSDGLAKNTSLTTLSLTVNNYDEMSGEWLRGLADGLAKNTSLTLLSLTVNNYWKMMGDLTLDLGDGLAKNWSLTSLHLTVNNYGVVIEDLTLDNLSDGLAENTSLTTLSLTVNNYGEMRGEWTRGLGDGLGKNTSLTMLSLTFNNYRAVIGDLTLDLGDGLAKNTSLTKLSLTVSNYGEMRGHLTRGLSDGLAKNTSLVTLNLTLSNCNNLYEDWILGLADALVTNTSLTAISLEVNIFSEGNGNSDSILA